MYLVQNSNRDLSMRPKYMDLLYSEEAKHIFLFRTRMIDVKCNYKGKYKNNNYSCRWCFIVEETQKHILEECTAFPVDRNNCKEEDVFSEDYEKLKLSSRTIKDIITFIKDYKPD